MELLDLLLSVLGGMVGAFALSYFKGWGQKLAEMATIKDITEKQESVKTEFARLLEKERGEINEQVNSRLESLKSDLNKQNQRHQIEHQIYHQKRAEAIETVYLKLIEFKYSIGLFIGNTNDFDLMDKVADNAEKLIDNLDQYRIYLPKEFCDHLDKFLYEYLEDIKDIVFKRGRIKHSQMALHTREEFIKENIATLRKIRDNLPKEIKSIVDLCRKLFYSE